MSEFNYVVELQVEDIDKINNFIKNRIDDKKEQQGYGLTNYSGHICNASGAFNHYANRMKDLERKCQKADDKVDVSPETQNVLKEVIINLKKNHKIPHSVKESMVNIESRIMGGRIPKN